MTLVLHTHPGTESTAKGRICARLKGEMSLSDKSLVSRSPLLFQIIDQKDWRHHSVLKGIAINWGDLNILEGPQLHICGTENTIRSSGTWMGEKNGTTANTAEGTRCHLYLDQQLPRVKLM